MDTPDWFSKSLCKNRHIDLWYPPLDSEHPDKYYRVAREVCNQCPVWRECLDVGTSEVWGMWGGLTPLERTALSVDKAPKASALRQHGTKTRYRQGCRCTHCEEAHLTVNTKMNINSVPLMTEKMVDLDVLMFLLLDPPTQ